MKKNLDKLKAQAKEMILWSHLSHENIVPFYGVYLSDESEPGFALSRRGWRMVTSSGT
ncbi:hypothetical protein AN958_00062 [Leucoagaricus sp. SymC.cos]|nr:hypothetical protein AN958_00062 [Leucoagaricus sp. SymC.cos]